MNKFFKKLQKNFLLNTFDVSFIFDHRSRCTYEGRLFNMRQSQHSVIRLFKIEQHEEEALISVS